MSDCGTRGAAPIGRAPLSSPLNPSLPASLTASRTPHPSPALALAIDCDDMEISVLLFASWADALGPAVTVTVPAAATVRDVLDAVQARAEGRALPKPLVAVNHRYAKPESPVRAGDEIALIPPVAGG